MNELIQKLAEESGLDARTMGVTHTAQWNARVTKLAELIVRECVEVINDASVKALRQNTFMGDDVPSCIHESNIMKHFGVEE
jgi:hypothetical protein